MVGYHHLGEPKTALAESLYRGGLVPVSSLLGFENAKERYRASFLIREYVVTYEGGKKVKVVNSIEIYDDMLLNGITLDDADWVEWCDGTEEVKVERKWRRNVPLSGSSG